MKKNRVIVRGNAQVEGADKRGWFVGAFIDSKGPQKTANLEVKWTKLVKGEVWETKASSGMASTLGILISGSFKVEFENETIILDQEGDYMIFYPNQWHRNTVLEDGVYVTVRWPSLSATKN